MAFNILEKPVMYALYETGETHEISLIQAFEDSKIIKQVSGDYALQEILLVRLMIAILYRAYGDNIDTEEQWEDLWEEGIDVDLVKDYLKEHEHRFDLFSETEPFYQVTEENAEYEKENAETNVSQILLRLQRTFNGSSSKDPRYYFGASTERGVETLSPSEAFRSLLTLQAYNTASRKSVFKGDPRTKKRMYAQPGWNGNLTTVLIVGNNLEQTLLLNTVPYENIGNGLSPEDDVAVWEQEQQTAAPSNEFWEISPNEEYGTLKGVVEAMTFQSTRVHLENDGEKFTGSRVGIGDRLFRYDQPVETMSGYHRITRQTKEEAEVPTKFSDGQSWLNVNSLLAFYDNDEKRKRKAAHNVSFFRNTAKQYYNEPIVDVKTFTVLYGAQDAIIEDIVVSSLDLNADSFSEQEVGESIISAAKSASDVSYVVRILAQDIFRASGGSDNSRKSAASIQGNVMSEFEPEFRKFAATINKENALEKRKEWIETLRKIARKQADTLIKTAPQSSYYGTQTGEDSPVFTVFDAMNKFNYNLKKQTEGVF